MRCQRRSRARAAAAERAIDPPGHVCDAGHIPSRDRDHRCVDSRAFALDSSIARRTHMTGILPAVVEPDLTGTNQTLVIIVLVIALGALAMAMVFRRQVLAAGEGTDNMKTIAQAVQEGANAYLARQFRTLAVFAAIAFVVLFALPAEDTIGAHRTLDVLPRRAPGFSAAIGYLGMSLAVRANLRVAAAAENEGREAAMTIGFRTGAFVGHGYRRSRSARREHRRAHLQGRGRPRARGLRLRRRPPRDVHASRWRHLHQGLPTSVPTSSARSSRAFPRTTRATPPPSRTTSATTSATAPAWPPTCSSRTPSRWSPR